MHARVHAQSVKQNKFRYVITLSEDLDYEGMYNQLSKEKREYKDQVSAVILSSTTLEFSVNKLIEIGVRIIKSTLLEKQFTSIYVPISSKLRLLRFANLIDEELYKNLNILFKIRNTFAHALFITAKDSTKEFNALEDIQITNKFVRDLPNDSKKFQLIVSKCFVEIIKICEKLDPSFVMKLELVGDIEEIHVYEEEERKNP